MQPNKLWTTAISSKGAYLVAVERDRVGNRRGDHGDQKDTLITARDCLEMCLALAELLLLVARVPKRLAQMMQIQAELKIIEPRSTCRRSAAVNSFGVTYAKLTYWLPTRSRARPFLMENNPYLNSTETFSTRCSTEP